MHMLTLDSTHPSLSPMHSSPPTAHTCIHTYIHTHIYIYIHTYIYIYTYTHTHIYIHTQRETYIHAYAYFR